MKEVIKSKQAISILVLFFMGSTLVVGTGTEAKQDEWMSILIAALFFIPIGAIYIRLTKLYPEKNLYDIIIAIFGKVTGGIVTLLYIFYSIHLGALVIRNFSEFINILSMPETPQVVFQIFLIAFSIWMVKNGIEVIGRWSKFVLPVVILAVLGTLLISIKDMNLSYLKPIGGSDFSDLLTASFSTFSFPFAETILFLSVYRSIGNSKQRDFIYLWALAIGIIVLQAATFRNLLVLGVPNLQMLYFPSYSAASIISIGDFFSRIEVLIGVNFLIAGAVKISICLLSACVGITSILKQDDYHTFAMPVGLLMLTLAIIVYRNTLEMFIWLKTYKYYALPFQVFLPVLIWLGAEIRVFLSKIKA